MLLEFVWHLLCRAAWLDIRHENWLAPMAMEVVIIHHTCHINPMCSLRVVTVLVLCGGDWNLPAWRSLASESKVRFVWRSGALLQLPGSLPWRLALRVGCLCITLVSRMFLPDQEYPTKRRETNPNAPYIGPDRDQKECWITDSPLDRSDCYKESFCDLFASSSPASCYIVNTKNVGCHIVIFHTKMGGKVQERGLDPRSSVTRNSGSVSYDRQVSCVVRHAHKTPQILLVLALRASPTLSSPFTYARPSALSSIVPSGLLVAVWLDNHSRVCGG